jgi:hypothetical protein
MCYSLKPHTPLWLHVMWWHHKQQYAAMVALQLPLRLEKAVIGWVWDASMSSAPGSSSMILATLCALH